MDSGGTRGIGLCTGLIVAALSMRVSCAVPPGRPAALGARGLHPIARNRVKHRHVFTRELTWSRCSSGVYPRGGRGSASALRCWLRIFCERESARVVGRVGV